MTEEPSEKDATIAELRAERDRAREECGHEKAMRAYLHDEMSRWITSAREERERADKAEDTIARVEAVLWDHPSCIGECGCAINAVMDLLDKEPK